MPEFTQVASAHSLMPLRALVAQSYCSFSSFLFFDRTGCLFYDYLKRHVSPKSA